MPLPMSQMINNFFAKNLEVALCLDCVLHVPFMNFVVKFYHKVHKEERCPFSPVGGNVIKTCIVYPVQ